MAERDVYNRRTARSEGEVRRRSEVSAHRNSDDRHSERLQQDAARRSRATRDRAGRVQVSMRDDRTPFQPVGSQDDRRGKGEGRLESRSSRERSQDIRQSRDRTGNGNRDRTSNGNRNRSRSQQSRSRSGQSRRYDQEGTRRPRSAREDANRQAPSQRRRDAQPVRGSTSRERGVRQEGRARKKTPSSRQTRTPQYISVLQQEYGAQTLFAPQRLLSGKLLLVLAAIAIIVVMVLLVNAIGACMAGGIRPAKWGVSVQEVPYYNLVASDMTSLSAASDISTVSLSSQDDSFSLDNVQLSDVKDQVSKIEKSARCGFVFVDMSTGRGLVYNPELVMYCASAVKAPLCYYATTHPSSTTEGLTSAEQTLVENTIEWSSNDDYFRLCDQYFNEDYLKWLSTYGVSYNEEADGNFPSMGARSLAGIWVDIYSYIQGSSNDAKWLNDLFSKTETSFIRDGVKNEGATVRNKAGWITDGETDAVTDAGIITKDGRDYLMVIVSGLRDTEKGHKGVSDLAKSLFAMRGELGPSVSLTYKVQ